MAKRKQQPPDEGSPAWMSTFSDLMNLLLCFFVLLFASSNLDEGKIQKIAASFENMSFSVLPQGAVSLIKGSEVSGGMTQLPDVMSVLKEIGYAQDYSGNNIEQSATGKDGDTDADGSGQQNQNAPGSTGQNTTEQGSTEQGSTEQGSTEQTSTQAPSGAEIADALTDQELTAQLQEKGMQQSEQMYEEIQDMLESGAIADKQKIDFNSQYVELDMNGAILFESGRADISKESYAYLNKIASILTKYRNCIIEFEGHTDNVPMTSGRFKNNRYLSTARATSVYEYIAGQEKLEDQNIKIAGYGESRPLVSNDTAEGRARNRRVVIKIYNQLSSNLEQGDKLQ